MFKAIYCDVYFMFVSYVNDVFFFHQFSLNPWIIRILCIHVLQYACFWCYFSVSWAHTYTKHKIVSSVTQFRDHEEKQFIDKDEMQRKNHVMPKCKRKWKKWKKWSKNKKEMLYQFPEGFSFFIFSFLIRIWASYSMGTIIQTKCSTCIQFICELFSFYWIYALLYSCFVGIEFVRTILLRCQQHSMFYCAMCWIWCVFLLSSFTSSFLAFADFFILFFFFVHF